MIEIIIYLYLNVLFFKEIVKHSVNKYSKPERKSIKYREQNILLSQSSKGGQKLRCQWNFQTLYGRYDGLVGEIDKMDACGGLWWAFLVYHKDFIGLMEDLLSLMACLVPDEEYNLD